MDAHLVQIYKLTRQWYEETYRELRNINPQNYNTQTEAADAAYAMRELHKWCDDMRKEAQRLKDTCDRIACVLWIANGGLHKSIKTSYCTATPEIRQRATIPKKDTDPDNFWALMDYLGIPREAAESDIVRFHWPGVVEYLTEQAAQGLPTPPGIQPDATHPVYSLRIRGRKAIDDGE